MSLSLTAQGQQQVEEIARRHQVPTEAALAMLEAVVRGGGSMAQFSHPHFGGSGQWMRGGMTMVGDMFNHGLKSRVDALCSELAGLIERDPALPRGGSFQSQSQGSVAEWATPAWHDRDDVPPSTPGSLFTRLPGASGRWWPASLPDHADSAGAQNDMRYAVFNGARRLAVDRRGEVVVHDTGDHRIGGVSQQQSGDATLTFTSQHGPIDLRDLPVVSDDPAQAAGRTDDVDRPDRSGGATMSAAATPVGKEADIVGLLEKLLVLHQNGVLTAEEFADKKRELLARI